VAIVNNMPDAALEATERQFLDILGAAAGELLVRVSLYSLPSVTRDRHALAYLGRSYGAQDELWDRPPDGIIVTGTEPQAVDLEDEPCWDDLTRLISWAESSATSAVLSCLAAHAAALLFDGLSRVPLPAKCSGVFDNAVVQPHPLVEGLTGRVPVPHSRLNDVPREHLAAAGYAMLLESPEASWTVAVKRRGGCQFVLVQGHPEYGTTTLLREYRRDVRRFLEGERAAYPPIPSGYVDDDSIRVLCDFRAAAIAASATGRRVPEFPYDAAARAVVNTWQGPAERFYGNWLRGLAGSAHVHG
jgi:homoserine O-succinyltransferase